MPLLKSHFGVTASSDWDPILSQYVNRESTYLSSRSVNMLSSTLSFHRDNLVLLQVGFKSLSYEMQEQKPAYDSNTLFGKQLQSLFIFLPKLLMC